MPRGGKREGAGRPKGAYAGDAPGRKTIYKVHSVYCNPDEYELIKEKAAAAGKTASRYLIDLALDKNRT